MKATLEFEYPEDEDKLRYAIHGQTAIMALLQIEAQLRQHFKYEMPMEDVFNNVSEIVNETLTLCGENQ
jgi:CYTH domain-containing protein